MLTAVTVTSVDMVRLMTDSVQVHALTYAVVIHADTCTLAAKHMNKRIT